MNRQPNSLRTLDPHTTLNSTMTPTQEKKLSQFSFLATLVVAAVMAFALVFGAQSLAHGTAADTPDQTHVQPDAAGSDLHAESSDGGGKG